MKKRLALLHTGLVFIEVEVLIKEILVEVMAGVDLFNIVDDSLLPEVMAAGKITPQVQHRITLYAIAAEQKTGLSVLTSPRMGIEYARQVIDGL